MKLPWKALWTCATSMDPRLCLVEQVLAHVSNALFSFQNKKRSVPKADEHHNRSPTVDQHKSMPCSSSSSSMVSVIIVRERLRFDSTPRKYPPLRRSPVGPRKRDRSDFMAKGQEGTQPQDQESASTVVVSSSTHRSSSGSAISNLGSRHCKRTTNKKRRIEGVVQRQEGGGYDDCGHWHPSDDSYYSDISDMTEETVSISVDEEEEMEPEVEEKCGERGNQPHNFDVYY